MVLDCGKGSARQRMQSRRARQQDFSRRRISWRTALMVLIRSKSASRNCQIEGGRSLNIHSAGAGLGSRERLTARPHMMSSGEHPPSWNQKARTLCEIVHPKVEPMTRKQPPTGGLGDAERAAAALKRPLSRYPQDGATRSRVRVLGLVFPGFFTCQRVFTRADQCAF